LYDIMTRRPRRGRHPLPDTERKDRVVQARVAEDLDAALRQEAKRKRVSVSQLIRNVLEETFHLVDDIVAGTANITQAVTRDARRIAASAKGEQPDEAPRMPAIGLWALERVHAWQEVVLNRDAVCARCATDMKKGDRGLFGLQDSGSAGPVWLCLACSKHI
jgi:hypothetical protein